MEPNEMGAELMKIIEYIQMSSSLECPPLSGAIKPVGGISKFDSKVWPVATTLLSIETGATIPNSVNIFIDSATKAPRAIDEIAAFVCELSKNQHQTEAAA